jgi:hypothetical protein
MSFAIPCGAYNRLMNGRLLRPTARIALWIVWFGLAISTADHLAHGNGGLLLVVWVIFTPVAFWGMRRIDREGWDKEMDRLDRGDFWG